MLPDTSSRPTLSKAGATMAVELIHYKLTADEYQRMLDTGILNEDSPVELIEGELVWMAAHGGQHIRCVTLLAQSLTVAFVGTFYVSTQNSIRLDLRSEPEPDIAILRSLPEGQTPPPTEDVMLVAEVSDSSLMYDLNVKAPLYARAGIPEYWVVDLTARRVLRHSAPRDGRYKVIEEFADTDQVVSMTEPSITIAVSDIFA
ncbi:MAG TPA: Uma2 family endonuclease [Thermomicrobiales bacterium]|nr:Uma2 family endonuclease [Thermomicrobiales bacterium]